MNSRVVTLAAGALACVGGSQVLLGALPRPDHVVVVIEENHSGSEVLGNSNAPYINSLATSGMNLTDYFAIEHPSQPNYLDLFSGSNQGVTTDSVPSGIPFTTPNLAGALRAKGLSFVGYSESLPSVGYTGSSSDSYVRKHNPWVNWQSASPDANQLPSSVNQPFSSFPASGDYSSLPTVSFVVPNLQNDMHDGTIDQADTWLLNKLGAYSTWARTHNSLLVVTFDEDDRSASNKVPAILTGQMVKRGSSSTQYDHYDLLRTLSDMYGTAPAGAAASASAFSNIWNSSNAPLPEPSSLGALALVGMLIRRRRRSNLNTHPSRR